MLVFCSLPDIIALALHAKRCRLEHVHMHCERLHSAIHHFCQLAREYLMNSQKLHLFMCDRAATPAFDDHTGVTVYLLAGAGWHGCVVQWVALAALLILAAPSAAALAKLKGQLGNVQVGEAAAADAQQRLLREDEAVHFQVVCCLSRKLRFIALMFSEHPSTQCTLQYIRCARGRSAQGAMTGSASQY